MKKLIIIISIIVLSLTASWYFDTWCEPVEIIDEVIGQNYDYPNKKYFHSEPDKYYTVNINNNLNEFDSGILEKYDILIDSIVHVFIWEAATYKQAIWVGQTEKMENQIIDAIRYNNNVQF